VLNRDLGNDDATQEQPVEIGKTCLLESQRTNETAIEKTLVRVLRTRCGESEAYSPGRNAFSDLLEPGDQGVVQSVIHGDQAAAAAKAGSTRRR
jgi:hypothetical protein